MTTSVDEAIGKWAAARPRRYEEESNRPGVLIMTEVRKKKQAKEQQSKQESHKYKHNTVHITINALRRLLSVFLLRLSDFGLSIYTSAQRSFKFFHY
jgi:hypothetical protein